MQDSRVRLRAAGRATDLDVLDSQAQSINTQINLVSGLSAGAKAVYRLLFAMGQLDIATITQAKDQALESVRSPANPLVRCDPGNSNPFDMKLDTVKVLKASLSVPTEPTQKSPPLASPKSEVPAGEAQPDTATAPAEEAPAPALKAAPPSGDSEIEQEVDEIIREEDAGDKAPPKNIPQARLPADGEQPQVLPTPQVEVRRAALPTQPNVPATGVPTAPEKIVEPDIPAGKTANVAPAVPSTAPPTTPTQTPTVPPERTANTAPSSAPPGAAPSAASTPPAKPPQLRSQALGVLRNLFRIADGDEGEPVFAEDDALSPGRRAPKPDVVSDE